MEIAAAIIPILLFNYNLVEQNNKWAHKNAWGGPLRIRKHTYFVYEFYLGKKKGTRGFFLYRCWGFLFVLLCF